MQILAIAVLVVFYAVYLGKMLAQKKQGIRTDQIARGKEKGKQYTVELVMKVATYGIIVVQLVSIIMGWSAFSGLVQVVGVAIAILGDAVFAISVFTMKDSWRAGIAEKDTTKMVTKGIYSISRNPAFLGFDLLYIGVLLMFFNVLLLAFTLFAILMLHLQILQEEVYLPTVFGDEYKSYCGKVHRYIGKKKSAA